MLEFINDMAMEQCECGADKEDKPCECGYYEKGEVNNG